MADNVVCQGFEGRSISLPAKVWGLLERVKRDRQDPTLSDTIRVLLLQQLAENSYLEDREKKALGVIAQPDRTQQHYVTPDSCELCRIGSGSQDTSAQNIMRMCR